ncbi:alpha/beta fold hydrolase [Soonwooa sp.]|uniref:alpha/beta fold hydrolase n=1 Tax=Soonwooa sp. TaxID=1938592 RepID=UPI0028AD11EB|nr:alpha/beta fold hydrolase [Soonwooa sp.]
MKKNIKALKKELLTTDIKYKSFSGQNFDIPLSYEVFGKAHGTAPIVLVNHALTGNSTVSGSKGWWKNIIGPQKIISTKKYSIICFNIPGNGYNDFFIDNYEDLTTKDVAAIFLQGLENLEIKTLHSIIGGSLGGSIGWEMLAINPKISEKFIPIASDYKTHDWLHAQCLVQKYLLDSPEKPLEKARAHAMLCYRTPESLNERFEGKLTKENTRRESEDWLIYHGKSLNERFSLKAYKLMNHLLMTVDTNEKVLSKIKANINLIAINTDLFFPASEIKKCYEKIKTHKEDIFYDEIVSIHGHDAFLIEYKQLQELLKRIY